MGRRRADGTGPVHGIQQELRVLPMGRDPGRAPGNRHVPVRPGPVLRRRPRHVSASARRRGVAALGPDAARVLCLALDRNCPPACRGHSRGSGEIANRLAGYGHRPHRARADRAGAVRAGSPAASRAAGRLVADRRGRAARSPDAVRGSLAGGVGETSGRLDCVERRRPGPRPSASRRRCPAG